MHGMPRCKQYEQLFSARMFSMSPRLRHLLPPKRSHFIFASLQALHVELYGPIGVLWSMRTTQRRSVNEIPSDGQETAFSRSYDSHPEATRTSHVGGQNYSCLVTCGELQQQT